MTRALRLSLIALAGVAVALALAFLAPVPIPFRLDFQVLWHADLGVLRGVPLYDREAQTAMVAALHQTPLEQQFVIPFPYPPWFATFTSPLALLPVEVAARLWFVLNCAMLAASIWLLSGDWPKRARWAALPLTALFPPVLGALYVGQFVFPALLGMAMLVHALRGRHVLALAAAAALVTVKPHVGAFALAAAVLGLWKSDRAFRTAALRAVLVAAIVLLIAGFSADRAWPLAYPRSLASFRDVSQCQLCVSLPMTIAGLAGSGFDQATFIAAGLLLLCLLVAAFSRNLFPRLESGAAVSLAVCLGLLINPYLQNYDFAFLAVPFLVIAGRLRSILAWLLFVAAYLAPWLALGYFGREGNVVLLASVVLLAALTLGLTPGPPGNRMPSTE